MLESTFSSVFGTAESLVVRRVSAADFLHLLRVRRWCWARPCAGVYMFRHTYSKNFVVTLALLAAHRADGHHAGERQSGRGHRGHGRVQPCAVPLHPRQREGHRQRVSRHGHRPWPRAWASSVAWPCVLHGDRGRSEPCVYVLSPFGKQKEPGKTLRITIPEDLEYDGVFDEVLDALHRRSTSSPRCRPPTWAASSMLDLPAIRLQRAGARESA